MKNDEWRFFSGVLRVRKVSAALLHPTLLEGVRARRGAVLWFIKREGKRKNEKRKNGKTEARKCAKKNENVDRKRRQNLLEKEIRKGD